MKTISDKLTEMLKRKKLVPKRKDGKHDDNESEIDNKQNEKQQSTLISYFSGIEKIVRKCLQTN